MVDYQPFLDHVNQVKDSFLERVASGTSVFVLTHHDADGLAAGAIISLALKGQGIPFQTRVISQISPKYMDDILSGGEEQDRFYIFTDFGSGQLGFLVRSISAASMLILDHHEIDAVEDEATLAGLLHLNPWLFNIDGSVEISGAGVTYLFAKALDPGNSILSPLAVLGALGDIQDKGEQAGVIGLNKAIVDDAIRSGLLSETIDLKVFGRFSRPIHLALSYTTDPYLPGLSGDEGACVKFLQRLKIPLKSSTSGKPRTISDLTKDEKSMLISAIIENSLKHGMNPNKVKSLIGNVYLLEQEDPATNLKDLREFASMLNSCGRQDAGGVGIAIAMGDRGEVFQEGQQLINEYRRKLSNYIEWVQAQGSIKTRDSLQIIEGGEYIDDAMIGTIVSILMSSKNITKDLPIIGWAKLKSDPSVIKISARGFQELVDKGLNLGAAIKETVKELDIDTPGGGHAPAAGAEIPEIKLDRFLKDLGKRVAAQLHLNTAGSAGSKKGQSWF